MKGEAEFSVSIKENKDFTDDDYLNPSISFKKYHGRDRETGTREAEKRKLVFNELLRISDEFAKNNDFEVPVLKIVGSTAVNMCTADSDLDIAVIIPLGHKFIHDHELWWEYHRKLRESSKVDFEIKPNLIIEGVPDTMSFLMGME